MLSKTNKLLILWGIPTSISITNGIYESWKYLDDFELEKENYKNTRRRVEKASIGFGSGFLNGIALSIFSPIIIGGAAIAITHSYFKR